MQRPLKVCRMSLQAVHSGADLQSAAATVMGYGGCSEGEGHFGGPSAQCSHRELKGLLQACPSHRHSRSVLTHPKHLSIQACPLTA